MKETKIILPTDLDAAKFTEGISGWVDINGRFWGKDERAARYSSSTHFKCDCGNIERRGWTKCSVCREKADADNYAKMPYKEWDGIGFIYSDCADKYFKDSDEIEDFCTNEDINIEDLRLVLCEPNEFSEVDGSQWDDIMPEDSEGDLPKELRSALDTLNATIRKLPPASYSPSKFRTSL